MDTATVLPVKIQPALLRPLAYRVLSKKYGLNIKSDGLASLAEFIGTTFGINWKKSYETLRFLEKFASVWREQGRGLFIDTIGVHGVIKEIKEREKAIEACQSKPSSSTAKKVKTKTGTLDGFLIQRQDTPVDIPSPVSSTPPPASSTQNLQSVSISPVQDQQDVPGVGEGEEREEGQMYQEELNWKDYFKVIDAYNQQKFTYDYTKRQYKFIPQQPLSTNKSITASRLKLPEKQEHVSLFPVRYRIIKDRVTRNENFQNADSFNPLSSMAALQKQIQNAESSLISTSSSSYMPITQIKNLLGRDGKNFLLFGLLRKNSKGTWSLEDPSGSVEIVISQAVPTKGTYYVPGCFVLAEGIYFSVGNKFHVSSITHPPGERREVTLDAIGNLDLLGVHGQSNKNYISKLDKDLKIRLHYLEKELVEHRFIIFGGDMHLDEMSTFSALRKVFQTLNEEPPTLIVFQGSFTSVPLHPSMNSKNISATTAYKNSFDTLASLLSDYEKIINETTLVFIPGVNDPWNSMVNLGTAGVWPQKPVPMNFVQRINRVCKNIVWGSNPTRIAYLSQEIVLVRDDINSRMKRHNILFPLVEEKKREEAAAMQERLQMDENDGTTSISQLIKSTDQLPAKVQESRKIVKTVLDQGHISPFTTDIRPIVWDLDYTLQLSPIPSTLILCDTTAPEYDVTYNGCKTLNPGRFIHKRRAKYLEFVPSLRKAIEQEIRF